MGELCALGKAGGARGVEDAGIGIGIDRHVRHCPAVRQNIGQVRHARLCPAHPHAHEAKVGRWFGDLL